MVSDLITNAACTMLSKFADVPLALSSRVKWADTLVAPSRLPHVPYQDLVKWIGAGALFAPEAAGCIFRPQDPEDLLRAGAKGMPLLIIWGTDDIQMDGQKTYDALSPKFTICEKAVLDGVGHMPFYE
jgi:pimeloyl-ACP methyl ester carboxylesterase